MTLCPIALISGCKKCPIFRICPVKTVIGDYRPEDKPKAASVAHAAKATKSARRRKK